MKSPDLSEWIQRYFQEYLVRQRNVSPATVAAYRDTFRLLLQYWRQKRRQALATLSLESLTPETVLSFLNHLEESRGNTIRTRNARLAALRSFMNYLTDWLGPDLPAATRRLLTLPFKRQVKPLIGYLTRLEIEALLAATEDTWTGRRDHLLLVLLYNTGARISELLALRVQDVLGPQAKQVELQGKGRKRRTLPLWRQTQRLLRQWIRENRLTPSLPLLPNRYGEPLTRFGAFRQIKKLVQRASAKQPTLSQRPISPHLFRHACAMRMLEAGITPEVIALWLGHESFNTTRQYVEANLAMKQQALEKIVPPKNKAQRFRPDDKLLRFLESL
jgi:site-specific recombinase XerD